MLIVGCGFRLPALDIADKGARVALLIAVGGGVDYRRIVDAEVFDNRIIVNVGEESNDSVGAFGVKAGNYVTVSVEVTREGIVSSREPGVGRLFPIGL